MTPVNTIICGDAATVLKTLPDSCVHMAICSPPYWNLRRYLSEDAVVLRADLSEPERQYVLSELQKARLLHARLS